MIVLLSQLDNEDGQENEKLHAATVADAEAKTVVPEEEAEELDQIDEAAISAAKMYDRELLSKLYSDLEQTNLTTETTAEKVYYDESNVKLEEEINKKKAAEERKRKRAEAKLQEQKAIEAERLLEQTAVTEEEDKLSEEQDDIERELAERKRSIDEKRKKLNEKRRKLEEKRSESERLLEAERELAKEEMALEMEANRDDDFSGYKLFRDKTENFSCDVLIEGASSSNASARLIVESPKWNLVFDGVIENGRIDVPIKKLSILDEGTRGSIRLEVIVEDTVFVPWEDDFLVKQSKNVSVRLHEKATDDGIKVKILK